MRRLALVLVGSTACYQPIAATGVRCSPGLECPTGQRCDRTAPVPTCVAELVDAAGQGDGPPPGDDAPPIDAPVPLVCPSGYQSIAGSTTRYRAVINPVVWENAAADCADDAPAGSAARTHLAVISNDSERIALDVLTIGVTWIGLSDRKAEGAYTWVTAEATSSYPPKTIPPWGVGQPSGGNDVNCVYLSPIGGLDDERCDLVFSYLCECDAFANDPARY